MKKIFLELNSNPFVKLSIPIEWSLLDNSRTPFTLADVENGVGVLQVTLLGYKGGEYPAISAKELEQFLVSVSLAHQLGVPLSKHNYDLNDLIEATATYKKEDRFVQVWYVSDGKNLAFVTYNCEWERRFQEQNICEQIVRSMKFICN